MSVRGLAPARAYIAVRRSLGEDSWPDEGAGEIFIPEALDDRRLCEVRVTDALDLASSSADSSRSR